MCHKHLTLQTAARHFTWKPTQEPWLGALMSLFLFCGYTLNLLLVYIWILNDLDIDGKYISTYALERTRRGRVQRSSPLRCPERVLWNMVSRRGMPAAETIGADTIDVGLLSDLNTGRWFHDVSSMMPIFTLFRKVETTDQTCLYQIQCHYVSLQENI